MICQKCKFDFPENEIDESHDVPVYLFKGITRNERKNQADKFPRHYLCKRCHEVYEDRLREIFQQSAIEFSRGYF